MRYDELGGGGGRGLGGRICSRRRSGTRRPDQQPEEIGGPTAGSAPGGVYNWTPPEGAGQIRGIPLDVEVWIPRINLIILTDQ
ncbi:hypothetical protein BRADI_1g36325v3 [Brachypodium distachyon]|uniref:Uncharacterized protein n=1 Tax=Brachypodium distachyon TaxID=15368 RepID=A0A2K2DN05_BRADI|nr:hypothetical protein BRADI_1g36325v3 [Brachypodium distachyon]